LLVDLQTKKAKSPTCLGDSIPYQEHEHALRCYPERFPPQHHCRTLLTKKIRVSDLDVNRHVNNARHIEYLMDCFDLKHRRSHDLRSLTVAFVSNAKYGEEVDFCLTDHSENSLSRSLSEAGAYDIAIDRKSDRPTFGENRDMSKQGLSKVGKRGAIVLPASLRRRFGLKEGSYIVAEESEDGILIRPAAILPYEKYSRERIAEFLLGSATDSESYAQAVAEIRRMGFDPEKIDHFGPPGV
jgi:AbrB family looped-hinge helix DNA binding protein